MGIVNNDLSLKKSEVDSDALASNGGYLKAAMESVTSTLFPDITGAERTTGLTRYRKVYFKNDQASGGTAETKYADLALLDAKVYLASISPAMDSYAMCAGSVTDVQSAADDYAGWAGIGYLEADAAQAATSFQVRCEVDGSAGELFQTGGTLILSRLDAGVVTRETVTISGTSWGTGGTANLCTISCTATPLAQAWVRALDTQTCDSGNTDATHVGKATATYTVNALIGKRVRVKSGTGAAQMRRVVSNTVTRIEVDYAWTVALIAGDSEYEVLDGIASMCVPLGSVVASYNGVVVTSAAGTFTASGNLEVYSAGTLNDTWTIIFSSATVFSVSGAHYTGLTLPAGAVGAIYRPANGTSFLFEIDTAAWGGTFTTGDTVVFNTVSSAKAFWLRETVPSTATPYYNSSWDIGAMGDTA
jgi:hypothetical protein